MSSTRAKASDRRRGDVLKQHRTGLLRAKQAWGVANRKVTGARMTAPGIEAADVLVLLALTELLPGEDVVFNTEREKAPCIASLMDKTGYSSTTVAGSLVRMETELGLTKNKDVLTWGTTRVACLTPKGEALLDAMFPPK
jgi:hypothetical protein